MKKLSDFLDILIHIPTWNGSIWYAGHPGSGRQPSTRRFNPAVSRREHNGTDFAAVKRTGLYAPHSGLIRYARWQNNGAGHAITINHGDTLIDIGERFAGQIRRVYTRHLHMWPNRKWQTKMFEVREGQQVVQGQLLGYIGTSGASAGYHDHCEAPVDQPYQPAYKHMNLDTELIYTGMTKGYWGGGEDMAMVEDMQVSLNRSGFTDLNGASLVVDGKWGRKTAEANAARDAAAAQTGGNVPTGEWVEVWGRDTGGNQ